MSNRVITIHFQNKLIPEDVSQFRSAINASMGDADVLFHNHGTDGLRYAYPLIQYKSIDSHAAIVGIGDGAVAIRDFFDKEDITLNIGQRREKFQIKTISFGHLDLNITDGRQTYQITDWLALNQENYREYLQIVSLAQKLCRLEQILTANILSLAKNFDTIYEQPVCCEILSIDKPRMIKFKNIQLMAFDATFSINVDLPDFISLGKGASQGHGTIRKITK